MKSVPEIKQKLKNALPVVGIKDTFVMIKKHLPEHAEKFNSLLLHITDAKKRRIFE